MGYAWDPVTCLRVVPAGKSPGARTWAHSQGTCPAPWLPWVQWNPDFLCSVFGNCLWIDISYCYKANSHSGKLIQMSVSPPCPVTQNLRTTATYGTGCLRAPKPPLCSGIFSKRSEKSENLLWLHFLTVKDPGENQLIWSPMGQGTGGTRHQPPSPR